MRAMIYYQYFHFFPLSNYIISDIFVIWLQVKKGYLTMQYARFSPFLPGTGALLAG